jgi:hypothetical protein
MIQTYKTIDYEWFTWTTGDPLAEYVENNLINN